MGNIEETEGFPLGLVSVIAVQAQQQNPTEVKAISSSHVYDQEHVKVNEVKWLEVSWSS